MEDSNQPDNNIQERLTRKRKYEDSLDCSTSGGDTSLELLDLPSLALEKIFSFLPVWDLKNVRLVSSRMCEVVLDNDKRFRTWTIDTSRDLPEETEKVFQRNFNIKMKLWPHMNNRNVLNYEEFYTWLIKHSSCITALQLWEESDILEKVKVSLSQLKQVRELSFTYRMDENTVKTLLSSLGPQLKSLTLVKKPISRNDMSLIRSDLSSINLSSLKHLQLYENFNKEMIYSILAAVPANIESIDLQVSAGDFEIPSGMKEPTNLKYLGIINFNRVRKMPTKLLCKTLSRLLLDRADLLDLEPVDIDLPSLNVMQLIHCKIKMPLLEKFLLKSAKSLTRLTLAGSCSSCLSNWKGLDFCLPALTNLELENISSINLLSQLISASSRSLTILKLEGLRSCNLDELSCDLPMLTILELEDIKNVKGLSQMLSLCSRSLTKLKLRDLSYTCTLGELTCNLPVLITLELDTVGVNWLPLLINACSRSLTILKLSSLPSKSCSYSLDELACDLPALKKLIIKFCDTDINYLLRKCSSSLQTLYFEVDHEEQEGYVEFEVNLPNLKELYLINLEIDGFTNLVSPQESRLEIIGLEDVGGSFWNDVLRCRFANLKEAYLPDPLDPMTFSTLTDPGAYRRLKTSLVSSSRVQVITDSFSWYDHLKYREID